MCSDREVIREGIVADVGDARESGEKGIIRENKEERREGAPLFDAPLDVDNGGGLPPEARGDTDVGEGGLNKLFLNQRKLLEHEVESTVFDRNERLG